MGNDRDWEKLQGELDAEGETPSERVEGPGPSDGPPSGEHPDAVTIELDLDDEASAGSEAGQVQGEDAGQDVGQESGSEESQSADAVGQESGSEESQSADPADPAGRAREEQQVQAEDEDVSPPDTQAETVDLSVGGESSSDSDAEQVQGEETGQDADQPSEGEEGQSVDDTGQAPGEQPAETERGHVSDPPEAEADPEPRQAPARPDIPTGPTAVPSVSSKPPAPPPPLGVPSGAPLPVRRDVLKVFRDQVASDRSWERSLVQAEIEALSDKKRRGYYFYELGELEERFFGAESAAAKAYREAVRLHAGLLVNLWAVRRVLSRHGKWKNVLKLLDAELKLSSTHLHRREVLLEKGALLEGHLADDQGAAECYRLVLEEDPGNLEALMSLEAVLVRSGGGEKLVELARRQVESTDSVERKVAILVELERSLRRKGADFETCRSLLEQATEMVGPDRAFFRELELLATIHGHHEELYDILGRHVEWSLSVSDWAEAVAVARRMARLALGPLDDAGRAAKALALVSEHEQASDAVMWERMFLAWMTSDWDTIIELSTKVLESDSGHDRGERLDLEVSRAVALAASGRSEEAYQVFASLWSEGAGREDIELSAGRMVLAISQGAVEETGEAIETIVDLMGRLFEGEESRYKVVKGRLLGALAHLRLASAVDGGNLDDTVLSELEVLCRRALAEDPADTTTLRLYEEVLLGLRAFDKLADLLEARSHDAQGEELTWVLEGLVWMSYGELDDVERGASALARLMEGSSEPLLSAFRLAFFSEKSRDVQRAASMWRKIADMSVDPNLKAEALLRAADLSWVDKGDADGALDCLRSVFEVSPGDQTALFQVERILTHEGRWQDLVDIFEQEAGSVSSAGMEERLLLKAADILEFRLERSDDAEEIYRTLVTRFPDRPTASWLLARAWRANGRYEDLVDYWMDRASVEEERAEALAEAARICEYELGQLERAEILYSESFTDNPLDVLLLERLITLAYAMDKPEKAVDALDRLLEARENADGERAEVFVEPLVDMLRAEAALLKEFVLDDSASAWEQWADLVDEDGLLGRMARWAGLRWSLRSGDWAGRGAFEDRLAASLEGLLGDVLTLRGLVHSALADSRPVDWSALEGRSGELPTLAAMMLRPIDESEGLGARRVEHAQTDADRGWASLRSALVSLRRDNWTEAYDAVCKAAEVLPEDPGVLWVAAEVASRAGRIEVEAIWRSRLGQALQQDERAADNFIAAARGFQEVGRYDDARWSWRQALARRPGRDAFEGLSTLLERQEMWKELAAVLTQWLDFEMDGDMVASLYYRRAMVREEHLDDVLDAAADYHRVLNRQASHAAAAYRLGMLYAKDGNGDRAVEFLERAGEASQDEALRYRAQVALAEVKDVLLDQEDTARALFRDLVDVRDDADAWERWLAFSIRRKRWEDAEEAFSRLDGLMETESDRADLAIRQALFYRDLVVNRDKAAQSLERARSLQPQEMEPVRLLVGLYKELGDSDAVAMVVSSALQEQMRLLGASPLDAALFRNIVELSDMADAVDRKFFAAAALSVVGHLDEQTAEWFESRKKDHFTVSSDLSENHWSSLLLRPEIRESGATEVWRAIGYGVARLEGKQPSDIGLGRSDKVAVKKVTGRIKEILELAGRLGVNVEAVYRRQADGISWLDGEEGAILVVGRDIEEGNFGPRQWFRIGRQLAAARLRALTLMGLSLDKVTLYLTAAAVSAVPDYHHDLSASEVATAAKALSKAMPRRDRKALAMAAVGFARRPTSVEPWVTGLSRTFDRSGLLCCGDLEAAIGEVCRSHQVDWNGPEDGLDRLKKCDDAGELLVYAVSEIFADLRKELGMSWTI